MCALRNHLPRAPLRADEQQSRARGIAAEILNQSHGLSVIAAGSRARLTRCHSCIQAKAQQQHLVDLLHIQAQRPADARDASAICSEAYVLGKRHFYEGKPALARELLPAGSVGSCGRLCLDSPQVRLVRLLAHSAVLMQACALRAARCCRLPCHRGFTACDGASTYASIIARPRHCLHVVVSYAPLPNRDSDQQMREPQTQVRAYLQGYLEWRRDRVHPSELEAALGAASRSAVHGQDDNDGGAAPEACKLSAALCSADTRAAIARDDCLSTHVRTRDCACNLLCAVRCSVNVAHAAMLMRPCRVCVHSDADLGSPSVASVASVTSHSLRPPLC